MKKLKLKNVLVGIFLLAVGSLLKAGQIQVHTTQGEQIVDFPGETLSKDWLRNADVCIFDIVGVTILDSVKEIDEHAFIFCFRLMNVTIQGSL